MYYAYASEVPIKFMEYALNCGHFHNDFALENVFCLFCLLVQCCQFIQRLFNNSFIESNMVNTSEQHDTQCYAVQRGGGGGKGGQDNK